MNELPLGRALQAAAVPRAALAARAPQCCRDDAAVQVESRLMAKTRANPHKDRLLALLDIAEAIRRESSDAQMLAFYAELRDLAGEHPTAAAARSLERDFLVEWNEGVGPEVEAFWRKVGEANIDLQRRRDIVAETLARGRVANMEEYCAIEDAFEALQTCGKVSAEQADRLNEMLDAFADAPENGALFGHAPAPAKKAKAKKLAAGQLVEVGPNQYRYDYVGRALTPMLQKKGYQGGGESWAGIARGVMALEAPELEAELRFDPEADCLALWATAAAPLKAVDGLLARVESDADLRKRALARAEADRVIE